VLETMKMETPVLAPVSRTVLLVTWQVRPTN